MIKLLNDWNQRRLYARKRKRVRESFRTWLEHEPQHYPPALPHPQTMAVLVDLREANPEIFESFCSSLMGQTQQKWQVYFLTDSTTPLESFQRLQPPTIRSRSFWITEADLQPSSALFSADTGHEWIAMVGANSILAPGALAAVLHEADHHPQARLMYSDHDHIRYDQTRCEPHFKPCLNPEMLLSWNYIGDQFYVRRDAWPGWEGGAVSRHLRIRRYALLLDLTARLTSGEIHHIPQILHHVRYEAVHARGPREKLQPDVLTSPDEVPVVQEHLNRHHPGACARLIQGDLGIRVEFPVPEPSPKVSIIIPTRNAQHFFERCVRSLVAVTDYPHFEILLVDNGSDDPKALEALTLLARDPRVKVLRDDSPFNFSALNNRAVPHAQGDLLLLLNNDTEFTQPGWLREMVSLAVRPEIGCVGAKLYYPDGRVQHIGVVTGICGVATHVHWKIPGNAPGHFNRAVLLHSVSVVTGACLMIRRAVYEQLGGLNERDLAVAYNDVDFCLRVRDAGLRNVITPFAQAIHHESATRGRDTEAGNVARFSKELAYMKRVWGTRLEWDPAYNPNLTLEGSNFEVALQPRIKQPAA